MKTTRIEFEMESNQNAIDKIKADFSSNPMYHLIWNAEDLYKRSFRQDLLTQLDEMIRLRGEDKLIEDVCKELHAHYLEQVLKSYNVRERSTGDMHRVCSLWKHEVMLDWVEEITRYWFED